jgi:hypothetical protein
LTGLGHNRARRPSERAHYGAARDEPQPAYAPAQEDAPSSVKNG